MSLSATKPLQYAAETIILYLRQKKKSMEKAEMAKKMAPTGDFTADFVAGRDMSLWGRG